MGGKCYLFTSNTVAEHLSVLAEAVAAGKLDRGGTYMLCARPRDGGDMVASAPIAGTAVIWHRRFFHMGYENLTKATRMVDGIPPAEVIAGKVAGDLCRPCVKGKVVRAPFPASESKNRCMDLTHSDVAGPFALSIGCGRYLITL